MNAENRRPPDGGGLVDGVATVPPAEDGSDRSLLPIIVQACEREAGAGAGRRAEPPRDSSDIWIKVLNERAPSPGQGWKLHLSAGAWSAETVLRRALPVLLAEDASFKVAASLRSLEFLNEGEGGLSQIGKFITVYPNDDAQAVRLALALDEATRGLRGPAVPSDRPLRPGSLVHYRYGGFDDRHVQTPLGEILPAIERPDGELVPDRRLTFFSPPDWVEDPFIAAGVAPKLPPPSQLVAGRYLMVATLHHSFRGAVHLAMDVETPRRCVLKRAWRDAMLGRDGRDARDHLRHEAGVLARLAPDSRFPAVFDLVEEDGDLFLVLEDLEGQTLEEYVGGLALHGRYVSGQQVVAWGRELGAALDFIHASGFVYSDSKSPNVIVAPSGRLHLVDFGLAYDLAGSLPPFGKGTPGYMSPQQERGELPRVTDDVYGLGALLFFMATGADPSIRPRPLGPLDRHVRLLNPGIGAALAEVIARCLCEDPAGRYPSMAALDAALAAVEPVASVPAPAFGAEAASESEARARRRARGLARRLGDTLCSVAVPAPDGNGAFWISRHEGAAGLLSRDLNTGSAGPVLALAELVGQLGVGKHRRALSEGARWLLPMPQPAGRPLPGLYVGEAGPGAALLRAGQVLEDADLIAAAAARGRWIATLPYASPDLYNGTAGRLRFHLLLWDETGDPEHLGHVLRAGEVLLAAAEEAGPGEVRWRIPPGYDGLSGCANLGYAHGAAGIADALLDLFEATGDDRFLAPAQAAGRWLGRQALPLLEDGSGLDWPGDEGEGLFGAMWCHGACGIGRFFLHAAQLEALPEAGRLWAGAARSVARGARRAGPTQCHGLAGNIEFLLDALQATGDRAYLAEARSLGSILETFALERGGMLVWPSEEPTVVTPDYWIGYAGVAVCLLRLADPERLPHQLSRRGFRQRPRRSTEGRLDIARGSDSRPPRTGTVGQAQRDEQ